MDREDGQLERKQPMSEMPKVLSTVAFKNAIIDKYKSIMGIDTKPRSNGELLSVGDERFSEISDVPSRIDSDFRFVGDETDAGEVVRRAPDFESVIVLLDGLREDKLKEQLSTVSVSEARLEAARERSQRLEDLREGLPEYDYERLMEAERQQLLKDMGPPWLLLYLFSRSTGRDRSYNYLEETSDGESAAGMTNDSFDMRGAERLDIEEGEEEYHSVERRRSSTYSMPASIRSRMSSIYSSVTRIANEVLSRVICLVDEAIIDGECTLSVASIASFIERKSHDESTRISEHDFETLKDFMEEAQRKELEVKDLNQLYHFFVGESFKSASDEKGPKRDRSKEITSIFEASGIEVDNTLLDAQISENMILGLVHKEPEPVPTPDSSSRIIPADEAILHITAPDLEAVQEDEEEPPEDGPSNEEQSPPPEVATQTEPLNIKCTELMRRKTLTRSSDLTIEYSCRIPPIPGIGPPLDEDVIQSFLSYLAKRALHQQGLIYPRNFRESPCPKIG